MPDGSQEEVPVEADEADVADVIDEDVIPNLRGAIIGRVPTRRAWTTLPMWRLAPVVPPTFDDASTSDQVAVDISANGEDGEPGGVPMDPAIAAVYDPLIFHLDGSSLDLKLLFWAEGGPTQPTNPE